jgi:hypothetical protein
MGVLTRVFVSAVLFASLAWAGPDDRTCDRTSSAFIAKRGDAYYLDLPKIRPSWDGIGADAVLKGDVIECGSVGGWLPNCPGCIPINAGDNVNQTFDNLLDLGAAFGAGHRDVVHCPVQANDSYANTPVANDALIFRQRAAQVQESIWGRCPYFPSQENCTYPARSFARSEVESGFLLQPTFFIGNRYDERTNRALCIHDAAKGRSCLTVKNLPPLCPTIAGQQGYFNGTDCHYPRPTPLDYGVLFQVSYRPNGGSRGNGQLIYGNASFDTCQRGFGPVFNITLRAANGQPLEGFCWYKGVHYPCTDFVRNDLWTPLLTSEWSWARFKGVPHINVLAAWDHNDNAGRVIGMNDSTHLVRLNLFYDNPTRDHHLTLVETGKRFPADCGPVVFLEDIDLVNNDTYEVTSKRYSLPPVCSGRSNRDPLTPAKLEGFSNARRFGYDAITSQHGGYDCDTVGGCRLRATLRERVQRAYEVALQSLFATNIQREESVTEVICYHKKGLFPQVAAALGDLIAIRFPDPRSRPVPTFAGHTTVYPVYPTAGGLPVEIDNDVVISLAAYEERSAI